MMRLRLASLAPLAIGASIAVGTPAGSAAVTPGGARQLAAGAAGASTRSSSTSLSPVPADLALLQIRFRKRVRGGLSGHSLRVVAQGAFGEDYLALATPRSQARAGTRALVLLVNRPSPLLDPLHVHLRLSTARALGTPILWRLNDPLSHPPSDPPPALCGLPLRGPALSGSDMRRLSSRGAALSGFDAPSAVAQAYDVACGLPHAAAFETAVTGRCSPGEVAHGTLCCPANAICASPPTPTPAPPTPPVPAPPAPPGCTPCPPRPGYACPLVAAPNVCIAQVGSSARRAVTASH
jgi:hypothetical protein